MSRSPTEGLVLRAVGLNLRVARSKRELTQEDVAELAGISRNYYNEVENGYRNVSLTNLYKIIVALEIEDTNEIINQLEIRQKMVNQYE